MKRPGSAPSTWLLIGERRRRCWRPHATRPPARRRRHRHRPRRPPSPRPRPVPSPSPVLITPPPIAAGPGPNGGTVVRWFIGLGAGTQPAADRARSRRSSTAYNASQKDVYISLEIVDNTQAANILKTEIAAGNAPDIIGPVGVEGLNLFADQLLDLKPLIAATGYTSTGVDKSLVDFFNSLGQNGATVGLPFAVYPSFIFYNKDLFEEAGLPLPADQGRRPVRRQAVGPRRPPHARDEADRRQERQGRHPGRLRPQQHRPVGLRLPVHGQLQRPRRDRVLRRRLPARRRRQDRASSPTTSPRARSGTTTASGRTTSSRPRPRSRATCSAAAASSAPATSRSTRATPGSRAASPRPPRRSSSSSASRSTPRSTARSRHRSMRTRSASSRRRRCRMRHSRP